ncbi:unnamed protein product, partial [Discosporangium mesarthrocarpum]
LRVRAADTLRKALTFRDLRERVGEEGVRVGVVPLVGLLRKLSAAVELGRGGEDGGVEGIRRGQGGRGQGGQAGEQGGGAALEGGAGMGGKEGRERCRRGCPFLEVPVGAVSFLRLLALTPSLGEIMASAGVIPLLVEGLRDGATPMMKSVCGGCLASLAVSRGVCVDMMCYGVMPPLINMIRTGDWLAEVTGWGALAGVMWTKEGRELFTDAGGLEDLENILTKVKRRKKHTIAVAATAGLVERGDWTHGGMKTPHVLPCVHHLFREQGSLAPGQPIKKNCLALDATDRGYLTYLQLMWASSREEGFGVWGCEAVRERTLLEKGVVVLLCICEGNSDPGSEGLSAEGLFSSGALAKALLSQLERGTVPSRANMAEVVLCCASGGLTKEQQDTTIPEILQMLDSNVWRLQAAAAKVILTVYLEDGQRLSCAVLGAVELLLGMLVQKPMEIQGSTLAALLNLCDHPDVPSIVVEKGGVPILSNYLTTSRDPTMRLVVLCLLKVMFVCQREDMEDVYADMV